MDGRLDIEPDHGDLEPYLSASYKTGEGLLTSAGHRLFGPGPSVRSIPSKQVGASDKIFVDREHDT